MTTKIDKAEQAAADACAARGAAYLDEKLPGWEFQVNARKLDLGNDCQCVLGQLATDIVPRQKWAKRAAAAVRRGMRHVLPRYMDAVATLRLRPDKIQAYGFNISSQDGVHVGYAALTKAWRKIIRTRLS